MKYNFCVASQLIKIDMLIALFIKLFNASKEIVDHSLELSFEVQTTLARYVD